MANRLYPKGKEALLGADIDILVDTIQYQLLSSSYVYSDAHQFFSSITGAVGGQITLAGKTTTDGVFDANDGQNPSLTGPVVTQLVIFKWTGAAGTSPLLYYAHTGHGLPFTPNGRNLNVQWDNGPFKIFAL